LTFTVVYSVITLATTVGGKTQKSCQKQSLTLHDLLPTGRHLFCLWQA